MGCSTKKNTYYDWARGLPKVKERDRENLGSTIDQLWSMVKERGLFSISSLFYKVGDGAFTCMKHLGSS